MRGSCCLVISIGTNLVEALFLLNELSQAMHLDGDVCEFGIAQGATSALIGNEIRNTSKALWLFDSFEGLPRPTEKDKLIDDIFSLGSIEKYQGQIDENVFNFDLSIGMGLESSLKDAMGDAD